MLLLKTTAGSRQRAVKRALASGGHVSSWAPKSATHRCSQGYAPELTARVAMALSKLSGDEQGIILGQLRNTLEPRLVMYFSSASKELRALLTPAVRQQLRTDYEEATALCVKLRIKSCKELREATKLDLSPVSYTHLTLPTILLV